MYSQTFCWLEGYRPRECGRVHILLQGRGGLENPQKRSGLLQLVFQTAPCRLFYVFFLVPYLQLTSFFLLRGDSVSSEIANAWKIRVLAHCVRKMDYKGKKLDGFSRDIRINFDGMTALAVLFAAARQQAGLGLLSCVLCYE